MLAVKSMISNLFLLSFIILNKVFPIEPVDPNIAILIFILSKIKYQSHKQKVVQKLLHQLYLIDHHGQVKKNLYL